MKIAQKIGYRWGKILVCFAVLSFGFFACGDDGEPGTPTTNDPSGCESDTDCDGDEVCDEDSGECVGCVDDSHCDGDALCDDGSCVECIGDDDCDGEDVCRLGSCAECNDDDHCNEDQRCSQGECVSRDLCEGVECPSGEFCDEDTGLCVEIDASPGYNCHEPDKLGELEPDAIYTIEGDATGEPSTEDTDCSDSISGNAVYEFTVEGPMKVDFQLIDSEYQLVMEVREDSCFESSAIHDDFGCRGVHDQDSETLYAEEGVTYYAIVETQSANETGPFSFDIITEEMECTPMGGWWCDEEDDDVRVNCFAGMEERSYECGGSGCESDECRGDTCQNALELTASMTIEGDRRAYTNAFDFQPHPQCTAAGFGSEGPITDYADMVFYFPGLHAGQEIVFDTENSPTVNVFGIVQDCNEETIPCIAAEDQAQQWAWEVPDDGDYYGIINVMNAPAGNYDILYSIEVRD